MRQPTAKERAALAQVQAADAEEQGRANWWGIMSRQDKARALSVAGLNGHRAGDPLETFTPEERSLVAIAVGAHISKMEILVCLMGVNVAPTVARAASSSLH